MCQNTNSVCVSQHLGLFHCDIDPSHPCAAFFNWLSKGFRVAGFNNSFHLGLLLLLFFKLECEVKWALGSITMNNASWIDGIPVELFQILKDDAMKVLHTICQQIWKTQQWPQEWKWSVFIPILKKGNAKECSNYHTIALISSASKVMLKVLQARLQQYVNQELPDV